MTLGDTYEVPYPVLGKLIDKVHTRKTMEKSFEVGLKKLKDIMEKYRTGFVVLALSPSMYLF